MAKLSNINGRFAVEDDGAIQFNGQAGTSGYVLESRGASSPPVWTDRTTGKVTGSGTLNKVVRWTATGSAVGDGPITFSSNDSTFAGAISVVGGAITLGVADTSSGHINAYENLTFNIDIDNDDTNRFFGFYTNSADGSGTELVRIEEGGNVIIGDTSGTSPNSADRFLKIGKSNLQDCSIILQDAVETWEIYQNDDLQFSFGTTPTTVMTMQRTTGNVGIGTASPDAKLHIYGSASLSEMYLGEDAAAVAVVGGVLGTKAIVMA